MRDRRRCGIGPGKWLRQLLEELRIGWNGLLEAEIVTADGRVRVANACSEPDLFWALKGGGNGSFGVMTRLTLLTHMIPNSAAVIGAIKANSDDAFRRG